MSILQSLPLIVDRCKEDYQRYLRSELPPEPLLCEQVGQEGPNRLVLGDNLLWLRRLVAQEDYRGKVAFIYADPPFFSKNHYRASVRIASDALPVTGLKSPAYDDRWGGGLEGFLSMLTLRLLFMRDLLSDEGGLVLHLDWHAVHYAKVLLDEIFGRKRFINELIWSYKSGGASTRSFARKHDTLLYYAKGPRHYFNPGKEKSYNRNRKPYRFKGVQEYRDEEGWYTMVNRKDVLALPMVGRTAAERTGYATQKPERLLEILLDSCSRPGDLCADFFMGSGTLPAVAHRMGRNFLGCDSSLLALAATRRRLLEGGAPFSCSAVSREDLPPEGRLDSRAVFSHTASEERLCQLTLLAYHRPVESLPLARKDRLLLADTLALDPLALVDYWCLDTRYDGSRFQPDLFFQRQQGRLPAEAQFPLRPGSRVALRAYDCFGGQAGESLQE